MNNNSSKNLKETNTSQELLQQWNKDLEGFDFSLEPFLKRCQQEREEVKSINLFVGLLLKELQQANTFVSSFQLSVNNMSQNGVATASGNTYNGFCGYTQYTSTNYRESVINQKEENKRKEETTLSNRNTQRKRRQRVKKSNSTSEIDESGIKSFIIHVEHPELPKEKKKRGRPCKRDHEERDNYGTDGVKQIVILSNCYKEMKK